MRYSLSSRGSSTRTEREKTTLFTDPADTLYQIVKDRSSSAQHTFNVSDSRRFWNAFNLQPSINLTENWVDREFSADDTVKAFRRAAVWSASMSTGTAMYGTFGGVGPLVALRHTMEPSASLTYSPEFAGLAYRDTAGVRRNRFPGVSSFERRRLDLRLRNGFQGKVKVGEEVRKVDLLNWSLSSGYDFLASDAGGKGWSPVNSVLDLPRILGVDLSFNSVHDPYQRFRFSSYQGTGDVRLLRCPAGGRGRRGGVSMGAPGTGAPTSTVDWGATWGGARSTRWAHGPEAAQALSWNAGFSVSVNGSRVTDRIRGTTPDQQPRRGADHEELVGELRLQLGPHRGQGGGGVAEPPSRPALLGGRCSPGASWATRRRFYFRINVKSLPDIKYEQGQTGLSAEFGGLTRALP